MESMYNTFDFYELPESVYGYAVAIMLVQLQNEGSYILNNADMSFFNLEGVRESYNRSPNRSCLKFLLFILLVAANMTRYFFVIGPALTTFAIEGYILYNLNTFIPSFKDYEENGLCGTGKIIQSCVLAVFYSHLIDSLKDIYKEFVIISNTEVLLVKNEFLSVKHDLANATFMRFFIGILVFLEFAVWVAVLINGSALVLSSKDFLMMIQNSVAISFINEIGSCSKSIEAYSALKFCF